jgi:hypothetical protein
VSKAFSALMPVHNDLADVIAEQLAMDREAVEPLAGQGQLLAIAQIDRDLALTLKRLENQLQEADFAEAAHTADELCHRIRTHYLASLSDREGVAR